MELLQLFDENKNMLNEGIERDKKKEVPEGKYFMIILLFIENNNKFLIQKTSVNRNSEYATTGGHVTYGDDELATVIKEAKEELGIELNKEDLKEIEIVKYKKAFVAVYYCNKKININELKIQEEEVDGLYWMSIDEINKLIEEDKFRKSNIIPFQKVLEKTRWEKKETYMI